jgi:hypothetical protein
MVNTRLYPKPLITGFEIAGPVDMLETPGRLAKASIILLEAVCAKSCFLITDT